MKSIFKFVIFLAAPLLTIPAYGQHMNQKESPCANVVVTTELTKCLSDAKDRADVKLNSIYKEIRGRLEGADVESLTKTQRLWTQYRDANCSAERDLYEGGTAKYPVYFACLESLTKRAHSGIAGHIRRAIEVAVDKSPYRSVTSGQNVLTPDYNSHALRFAASPYNENMRLASCVFLLAFSLQLSAQSSAPAADFSLTLERTSCEGFCPWYSVTILGDGSVHYEGTTCVHVEGTRKKTIPVSDVNRLIDRLRDGDFFHWEEKTDLCVDYPEVRITASLNRQHKEVLEGCSAPGKILSLAEEIDTVSGTKSWVGNVRDEMIQKQKRLQLSAQETIAERCHASRDPFDNQAMPEQFTIPDAPKTARQVSCFTSFRKDSTMLDVVRKCGVPDKHAGSGIYIFVYYMNDCSTVAVGTPDLKRLGISHVKQRKTTVLFNNW